jgi:hypothetical protein
MKQILLMIAVVAMVGCGKISDETTNKVETNPATQKTKPTKTTLKTPENEPKKATKIPEGVTVEFVVKSAQSYVPKGDFIRLYSEESFMNDGVFVVQFPIKGAAEKLGVKNLVEHFTGKHIRVTGKVGRVIFSSTAETRPGIYLPDVGQVEIIKE